MIKKLLDHSKKCKNPEKCVIKEEIFENEFSEPYNDEMN